MNVKQSSTIDVLALQRGNRNTSKNQSKDRRLPQSTLRYGRYRKRISLYIKYKTIKKRKEEIQKNIRRTKARRVARAKILEVYICMYNIKINAV